MAMLGVSVMMTSYCAQHQAPGWVQKKSSTAIVISNLLFAFCHIVKNFIIAEIPWNIVIRFRGLTANPWFIQNVLDVNKHWSQIQEMQTMIFGPCCFLTFGSTLAHWDVCLQTLSQFRETSVFKCFAMFTLKYLSRNCLSCKLTHLYFRNTVPAWQSWVALTDSTLVWMHPL